MDVPNVRFLTRLALEYVIDCRRLEVLYAPIIIAPLADVLGNLAEDKEVLGHVRHYLKRAAFGMLEYVRFTGRKVNEEVLVNLGWILAAAPIYDYFFDGKRASAQNISRLEFALDGVQLPNEVPLETAMRYSAQKSRQNLNNLQRDLFERYLTRVHEAHKAELEARVHPDRDLLRHITSEKGGCGSLLGLVPLLAEGINHVEEAAVYKFGAFSQMIDDMRDVQKDATKGICTLITEGFVTFEEIMSEQRQMEDSLLSLGMPVTRTNYFLFIHNIYFATGTAAMKKYRAGLGRRSHSLLMDAPVPSEPFSSP